MSPDEMATCMGMDALRVCKGQPPRNFTVDEIIRWMTSMADAASKIEPSFITANSGDGKYWVRIDSPTMEQMHAWHDAVLATAKASPKALRPV